MVHLEREGHCTMGWKTLLFVYLGVVNVITLALFAVDKSRARQGRRRIRERTILLWVWVGGSLGGLLGMDLLRHKTRHPRFYIGLPAALLVHLAILGALWVRFFH